MVDRSKVKLGETISYEVWYGAEDMRYEQALSEEDAVALAAEHVAAEHPNVVVLKVTLNKEAIEHG